MKKHLLIISCSESKNPNPGMLHAMERYTGAWYGVINKLKKERKFPDNLDILIISAKYGLINSDKNIENYDWKMDESRARELRDSVISKLKNILSKSKYESILINLGSTYMEALYGFEKIIPDTTKISILKGTIGPRKRDLRSWILSIK
ncbi:MAG: peroxide stress protein YaaA [Candidatus Helarchaeota archaeon]|nr:peroxide stress protein YaaA [Candidatus Helarchaeota archaeon]